MTANRSFEQNLGAWLDSEAPHSPPPDLHKMVMVVAGTRRQRPGWLVDPLGALIPVPLTARSHLWMGRMLLVLALLLALLGAAVLGASLLRKTPTPTGRNGAIAFGVNDLATSPYLSVHTARPGDAGDRAIAPGQCPAYSHDGSVMVYLEQGLDTFDPHKLVRVSNDGGVSSRLLLNMAADFPPALSPDGTRLAWLSLRPGAEGYARGRNWEERIRDLSVGPIGGGASSRVVGPGLAPLERYRAPAWSPDGKSIAFVGTTGQSGAFPRSSIYVVGADGSNLRRMTSRPGLDLSVAWSPDGRYLAYAGTPDGHPAPSFAPGQDIFVIGADGTGEHAVTSTIDDEQQPAWSPDGSRLAFVSAESGVKWLTTVSMDGANAVGTPAPRGQQVPAGSLTFAWSPDAQRIVVVSGTPSIAGESSAVVVWSIRGDLQGDVSTLLTTNAISGIFDACPPAWQRLEPPTDD